MKNQSRMPPKPMKMPVQARSLYTVDAIFEATIQVLIQIGINQLTTTKVAEKAGVSVGTLYQYFPNKTTLLNAVLEKHLNEVVTAVELACNAAKGQPLRVMASSVVDAYVDAKFKNSNASKALYSVASMLGSNAIVANMTQRSQLALCDMLATAEDAEFKDLRMVSYVISTALVGPIQGLLHADAPLVAVQGVKQHLILMATGYLSAVASCEGRQHRE
jgi:AcrR family transcriptional regulator